MSTDWKQKSLTPVLLKDTDPSYQTVEDLLHAIDDECILNIAVTGPYGSGKSSVIKTLMSKVDEKNKFLDISLATLDADDSLTQEDDQGEETEHKSADEEKETQHGRKSSIEALNRKIEYSILQQLVYRETLDTLPFSRLKKIRHLSEENIKTTVLYLIGFYTCISLAFSPSLVLADTIYDTFNIPTSFQISVSIIAIILLFIMGYEILKRVVKYASGMRLQHVNVGGNEIEMKEEGSIFNRYLDEILYFFQCTDYDIVIIEDLDRFNTTDIFLKLRELNHLINNSKIVGRKIRFIYAVKDDMFRDSSRSKFFDYITTVIPVITTSNSKDKLREALNELGHESEVPDDRIRDIAFHIDDMRLLYNIVNEYHQYSVRLNSDENHRLDHSKMLAMVAIKNYHPHDFSLLHKREGKIYNSISKEAKRHYIKQAIEQRISNREQLYKKELDAFDKTSHLSATELRLVYLMKIVSRIERNVKKIIVDGKERSIFQIASSEDDFNTIIKNGKLEYQYQSYSPYNITFNFSEIEKEINPEHSFEVRLNTLSKGREALLKNLQTLENEKNRVHSFTVQELLVKFNLYEDDYFKSLGLSPMEEDFIRSGLIDEDYSDYISYFYPGMMSLSDHQLCLDMRLDRNPPYDSQIDDCDTLLIELPDCAFQYKSILNVQLLDHLAQNHALYKQRYKLTIDVLLTKHPVDFLVLYANEGERVDFVWYSMIEADSDTLWTISGMGSHAENTIMYRQWIKHCKKIHISRPQIAWINDHYDDIASCYSQLAGEMQEYFITDFVYKELTETSPEMLSAVVVAQSYCINEKNMPIVVKQFEAADDISKLPEVEEKELALKLDLITPTWDNIKTYYEAKDNVIDEHLINFISSHLTDLEECPDKESYAKLLQSLMEIDKWGKEQYACLCSFNPFYITISNNIKAISEDKIIVLVNSGAIEGTIENFKHLNSISPKVSVAFLSQNRSLFNECIGAVSIDSTLALALLSEPSFSPLNYEYVIKKIDSTSLIMTPALADKICNKLSLHYATCELEVLYQAIESCSNKNDAVLAAAHSIEFVKDHVVTTELLTRLGGKYSRLKELHISETFDENPSNTFIAKALKNVGYISSFSTKEGKLKINTKKSR